MPAGPAPFGSTAQVHAAQRALARPEVVIDANTYQPLRPTGTGTLSTVGRHGGAGLLIVTVIINDGQIAFMVDVGTTLLGDRHAVVGYFVPTI